ncbi:MAG TPA: hypothetical protein VNK03_01825 [Gammaproteobacteria bacterium]|nr:hypothetical protein [Gammaproteobacteria bacterium]
MYNFLNESEIEELRKICAVLHSCREYFVETVASNERRLKFFDAFLQDPTAANSRKALFELHPDKAEFFGAEAYFKSASAYNTLEPDKQKIVQAAMQNLITKETPADYVEIIQTLDLNDPTFLALAVSEIALSEDQRAEAREVAQADAESREAKRKEQQEANKEQEAQQKKETKQERGERIKREKEEGEKARLEKEEKNALDRIMKNVKDPDKQYRSAALLCHLKTNAIINGFSDEVNNFWEDPTNQDYYNSMLKKLNPIEGQRLPGYTAYIEAMDFYKEIRTAQQKSKSRADLEMLADTRDFLYNIENRFGLSYRPPEGYQSLGIIAKDAINDAEKNLKILDVANKPKEIEPIYALLCNLHKTAQRDLDTQRAFDRFWIDPMSEESVEIIRTLIKSNAPDQEFVYEKAINYYKELVSIINGLRAQEELSNEEKITLKNLEEVQKTVQSYACDSLEAETDSGFTLLSVLNTTIEEAIKINEKIKEQEEKENIELNPILHAVDTPEARYEATALLWYLPKTMECIDFKEDFDNFLKDPMSEANYKKLIDKINPNGKPINDAVTGYMRAMDFYKNLTKATNLLETRKANGRLSFFEKFKLLPLLREHKARISARVNMPDNFDFYGQTIMDKAIEAIQKQKKLDMPQDMQQRKEEERLEPEGVEEERLEPERVEEERLEPEKAEEERLEPEKAEEERLAQKAAMQEKLAQYSSKGSEPVAQAPEEVKPAEKHNADVEALGETPPIQPPKIPTPAQLPIEPPVQASPEPLVKPPIKLPVAPIEPPVQLSVIEQRLLDTLITLKKDNKKYLNTYAKHGKGGTKKATGGVRGFTANTKQKYENAKALNELLKIEIAKPKVDETTILLLLKSQQESDKKARGKIFSKEGKMVENLKKAEDDLKHPKPKK